MSCAEIFEKRSLIEDGTELHDEIDPDGRGKYIIRVRCFKENGRICLDTNNLFQARIIVHELHRKGVLGDFKRCPDKHHDYTMQFRGLFHEKHHV